MIGWLILAGLGLLFAVVALRVHWRESHLPPEVEVPQGQQRVGALR